MESTFLLHKPVIYGSHLANSLFLLLLLFHIIAAAIAPTAAIAAFLTTKGRKPHKRSGNLFAIAMVTLSLTGIVLDVVRLCFWVDANHTKYAGYSMPGTYPARLGFIFAGVCVLYLLKEVSPPRIFSQQFSNPQNKALPCALVLTGLALTAIIALRLNPWTGALWMIWTFTVIIFLMLRGAPTGPTQHEADVARHRFGTSCLAAFSGWGALQGFGPAIALKITGPDLSTTPYTGNQPGPFSPAFILFFISWAPFCLLAAYLIHQFSRLRRTKPKPPIPTRHPIN